MGDVEGWGAVGDGLGGESVGVFRGWGIDTGVCDGVFCVGLGNLCGKCENFRGGDVGACGFGVGGFRIGVCEFSLCPLFNLLPVFEPRGEWQTAEDEFQSDHGLQAREQRPFVNFYGPTFILYELSSPFLNFHWFFDKLGMTGSLPQWYNGILLLVSFFCCRLLWGTYQSIRVYQDVWAALHYDPLTHPKPSSVYTPAPESGEMLMQYAGGYFVPTWLAVVYLGANIVLNTLNFYWYGKMIETIKKRFTEVGEKKRGAGVGAGHVEKEEGVLVEGMMDSSTIISEMVEEDGTLTEAGSRILESKEGVQSIIVGGNGTGESKKGLERVVMNGGSFIEVEQTQVRRRNQAEMEE